MLVPQLELLVRVSGAKLGELCAELLCPSFGLGAGALRLLERASAGGDLFLGGLQRDARLLEITAQVRDLLFEALDQGSRRFHAFGEFVCRSLWVLRSPEDLSA